ncbi:MAG: acyl carrier protein [Rhizobiaceae bacterium]|nr:acyl carrier protein [Hyphomicrobiales bacterium]NRB30659.1 acyl carrier protein [Rhizobiaceae bacterium]
MLAKSEAANRVGQLVRDTISDLLEEQGLENPGVEDDAKLVDTLGLKSMDIAQVVLMLEDELDADPFQEIPITSVRTVGDLVNAYQVALDPDSASAGEADTPSEPAAPASVSRRANRRR